MIKIGTLFSGIGAFEEGLKNIGASFETLFACDNGEVKLNLDYPSLLKKVRKLKTKNEQKDFVDNLYSSMTRKTNFVKQTYLKNHIIKNNMFFQDVMLLDGKKWRNQLDVLVGGSPCQSFSSVGHKAGLEDARGTLFYEFARLVNEINPKVFVYENVRGMMTHDKGNTWKVIHEIFESLGYHFKYKLINSNEMGIPQKRSRVFVIGFRNKKDCERFEFPQNQKLELTMQDLLLEKKREGAFSINQNGDVKIKKFKGQKTNEKCFLSPKIKKYVMSPGTKNFKTKVEIDLNVARTILKTMGNKHRSGVDNYVTTNGRIRMLDPREAMRLMGFNDSFMLNDSRHQCYKQAGNSIVVPIIQKITKKIIESGAIDG